MRTTLLRLAVAVSAVVAISFSSPSHAAERVPFSKLPEAEQSALRTMVAPPPPQERTGPYSTPMYYLMHKGYTYHGNWDRDPNNRPHPPMIGKPLSPDFGSFTFDRARPDIQEEMIKSWVDLGLNVSHLNVYPVDGKLVLDDDYVEGLTNFVNLADKHGLKIGVRIDALDWWSMHPANPQNRIDEYVVWVEKVAELLKGKTLYYVVGDELSIGVDPLIKPGQEWTKEQYLQYFGRVSAAIKKADPHVKVSMFAISYGHYALVPQFLEAGYAKVGDAITVNSNDMAGTEKMFAEVRKQYPDMMFLSNGVGYLASAGAQPQYPTGTPYTQISTEEEHGAAVAKMMFQWWDLGASTAPYYVTLRNWFMEGKQYPYWYGFFGFEDYVVKDDKMTVKRYPAWYALQTITHTFYNRNDFKTPEFEVKSSLPLSQLRAYEHKVEGGSELVMILWNDPSPVKTILSIGSGEYGSPVRVDNFDFKKWTDQRIATASGKAMKLELEVGSQPVILRLFRKR